jgi:hypothetical protein
MSTKERRLLAQAFVLLPLTRGGVCLLGIKRWQRYLAKLSTSHSWREKNLIRAGSLDRDHSLNETARAQAIARIVKIATEQEVLRANCLQQTLVLWFLLRRHGIESEISFGTRKQAGQVQAHAWVELFGTPLNEDREVCEYFPQFAGVEAALQLQTNE